MNQNFYYYGRLFFGLGAATSLLHAIVYFLTGVKLPGFDSFLLWLIAVKLIALGGAVFLLKYYLHKKYWLPFSGGMLVVLGNVLLTITTVMLIVARKGHSFHIATIISTTLASLLYGVTLIIPAAGRQLWLRIAGLAILCISIVYAGAIYLALQTPLQVNETAVALEQWIVLAGAFVPLLFFMQFLREERLLKAEAASLPPSKSNETILAPLGLIAFLLTLIAGVMIAKDGIGSVVWGKVNAARAQAIVEKSETRTFVGSAGDTLHYLLMKPLDYDTAKKYPLVVCLPYGHYESPPAVLLSGDENRKKYPAFLFIPYNREGTSWGGIPEWTEMDEVVYECINALEDPGIDVSRRYVSGVSKGGFGSWHFITEHPEMFAAAIPVCGAGDPARAGEIVGVAVWAFHGAKDRGVPVSGSRDMIEALRKAGAHPKYTEYGHLGHNIWAEVSKTSGLLDWLFAQRKE